MANSITRHYGSKRLQGLSVHPGGINTELVRHVDMDDFAKMGIDMDAFAPLFKSPEQGAATQVWAAVAKHLEGNGGQYLEDSGETKSHVESDGFVGTGFAKHAYDEEKEERLWEMSCEMVGVKE
jgi:hypothetical protein